MLKEDYIKAYFESWREDLKRAKELLSSKTYYLEAILVLSCHIGALGSLRFPDPAIHDNEAYKRVVLDYSGKREFYEQVDLLFFLQWSRSELKNHGSYRTLKHHPEISKIILDAFGSEDEIKISPARYLAQQKVVDLVTEKAFAGFDRQNLADHLSLFSFCDQLYRYVRCNAVHNLNFTFVTKVHVQGSGIRYEDNHAITGQVLYETVECILGNLNQECLKSGQWPWEL